MADEIVLAGPVRDRLLAAVRARFPRKSFGFLLSDGFSEVATDLLLFQENIRNSPDWKGRFESYGRYFLDHGDAGFVASPAELWRIKEEVWDRGLLEVGVFHSHRRHPANFSQIDYEMHLEGCEGLWHLIVSMRNPALPQVRAFDVSLAGVKELGVRCVS